MPSSALVAADTTGPLTDSYVNGSVRNNDMGENTTMLVKTIGSFKLEPSTHIPVSHISSEQDEKRSPTVGSVPLVQHWPTCPQLKAVFIEHLPLWTEARWLSSHTECTICIPAGWQLPAIARSMLGNTGLPPW